MQKYTYIYWIHTDAMIKTQEDFFTNIYLSLYCKGSKRFTQSFRVSEIWRPNRNCNNLTPKLWPSALCLSRSPGLLNRRPRAHSAGWWLSLMHLISIFSGPQLIRAPSPFRPGMSFPTTSRPTPTPTVCNLTGRNCHWDSNSTELYTRSTPTRSLKSNV